MEGQVSFHSNSAYLSNPAALRLMRSVMDKEFEVLIVSQFTLMGYLKRNKVRAQAPPHHLLSHLPPRAHDTAAVT